jgi:hypothetical protein
MANVDCLWGSRWRAMDCRLADGESSSVCGQPMTGGGEGEAIGRNKQVAAVRSGSLRGGSEATRGKRSLARVIAPSPFPANAGMITELCNQGIAYPTYSLRPDRMSVVGCVRRIEGALLCRRISACHDWLASNADGPSGQPRRWRPSLPRRDAAHGAAPLSTTTAASRIGDSSPGARPEWGSLPQVWSDGLRIAVRLNVARSALPRTAGAVGARGRA